MAEMQGRRCPAALTAHRPSVHCPLSPFRSWSVSLSRAEAPRAFLVLPAAQVVRPAVPIPAPASVCLSSAFTSHETAACPKNPLPREHFGPPDLSTHIARVQANLNQKYAPDESLEEEGAQDREPQRQQAQPHAGQTAVRAAGAQHRRQQRPTAPGQGHVHGQHDQHGRRKESAAAGHAMALDADKAVEAVAGADAVQVLPRVLPGRGEVRRRRVLAAERVAVDCAAGGGGGSTTTAVGKQGGACVCERGGRRRREKRVANRNLHRGGHASKPRDWRQSVPWASIDTRQAALWGSGARPRCRAPRTPRPPPQKTSRLLAQSGAARWDARAKPSHVGFGGLRWSSMVLCDDLPNTRNAGK